MIVKNIRKTIQKTLQNQDERTYKELFTNKYTQNEYIYKVLNNDDNDNSIMVWYYT